MSQIPELQQVIASPRKFSEYALVPGHGTDKDRVFIDQLGFRPRNDEDAKDHAELYEKQARDRWQLGEVRASGADQYGRRFEIVIEVRGRKLRSGWVLRLDGVLWLATPFAGFAP